MDRSITVTFEEERVEALKKYLKRKAYSTIEKELEYALTRLYDKFVPVTVREFLEEDEEETDGSDRESGGGDGRI